MNGAFDYAFSINNYYHLFLTQKDVQNELSKQAYLNEKNQREIQIDQSQQTYLNDKIQQNISIDSCQQFHLDNQNKPEIYIDLNEITYLNDTNQRTNQLDLSQQTFLYDEIQQNILTDSKQQVYLNNHIQRDIQIDQIEQSNLNDQNQKVIHTDLNHLAYHKNQNQQTCKKNLNQPAHSDQNFQEKNKFDEYPLLVLSKGKKKYNENFQCECKQSCQRKYSSVVFTNFPLDEHESFKNRCVITLFFHHQNQCFKLPTVGEYIFFKYINIIPSTTNEILRKTLKDEKFHKCELFDLNKFNCENFSFRFTLDFCDNVYEGWYKKYDISTLISSNGTCSSSLSSFSSQSSFISSQSSTLSFLSSSQSSKKLKKSSSSSFLCSSSSSDSISLPDIKIEMINGSFILKRFFIDLCDSDQEMTPIDLSKSFLKYKLSDPENFIFYLLDLLVYSKISLFDILSSECLNKNIINSTYQNILFERFAIIDPLFPEKTNCSIKNEQERLKGKIRGGFVLKPTPGYYKNVHEYDFNSMYPSIIMTFNIGYTNLEANTMKVEKGIKNEDILSIDEQDIFILKSSSKLTPLNLFQVFMQNMRNKIRPSIFKDISNSIVGIFVGKGSVLGYLTLKLSRQLIISIKNECERVDSGSVIYGDTDSLFIKDNSFSNNGINETFLLKAVNHFLMNQPYILMSGKLTFKETIFNEIFFGKNKKQYVATHNNKRLPKYKSDIVVKGVKKELKNDFIDSILKHSKFSLRDVNIYDVIFYMYVKKCQLSSFNTSYPFVHLYTQQEYTLDVCNNEAKLYSDFNFLPRGDEMMSMSFENFIKKNLLNMMIEIFRGEEQKEKIHCQLCKLLFIKLSEKMHLNIKSAKYEYSYCSPLKTVKLIEFVYYRLVKSPIIGFIRIKKKENMKFEENSKQINQNGDNFMIINWQKVERSENDVYFNKFELFETVYNSSDNNLLDLKKLEDIKYNYQWMSVNKIHVSNVSEYLYVWRKNIEVFNMKYSKHEQLFNFTELPSLNEEIKEIFFTFNIGFIYKNWFNLFIDYDLFK